MKSETNVTFARTLRRLLDERGLTAMALSKGAELSHVAVGNYLNGRLPKVGELMRIAGFLGLGMEEVLGVKATSKDWAARDVQAIPARKGVSPQPDRRQLDEAAAVVIRAAGEVENSAKRLRSAVLKFSESLEAYDAASVSKPAKAPANAKRGGSPLAGVSSVVASAAEAGATSALAEARRRAQGSPRSPSTGAPTARKPAPVRAAARGSK